MARLAGITMAVAVLSAAPASARVLQPVALPHVVVGSAYVRVNQVGYSTSAAKRAYLMSSVSEAGASFSVLDGSTAVFSAPIGPQLGSWSANFPHVYALDFPTTAAGTYTITVSGPVAARSPGFAIGAGSAVYAGAIGNALNFYQDERDGPDYIPSPLRTAPAHLNDEHAMTYLTPKVDADGIFQGSLTPLGTRINAAGGWWDAGDYLKFVQTESYTTGVLLSGLRDFPAQMGPHSGADFTAETKFGVRWLLRMWNDRTKTLYYQVGVGEANDQTTGDHDIWRLPQADDTWGGHSKADRYIRHRPVFRAGRPGS
ncbi:MAG TPA: glycoside hydrolase family 9 protein, partial [Gaiellales bacterium]|nr:glycoside hydrolase family 9 protein [Gaiellales bacterium]